MAHRLEQINTGDVAKKGCLRECTNYRYISLISHMCKIMLNVLLERMKGALEDQLSEDQGSFKKVLSLVFIKVL